MQWKIQKKAFTFFENFIWTGCCKFSLLPTEYWSSGDNVLANGLKIPDITKKNCFQLKFSQSDEQME